MPEQARTVSSLSPGWVHGVPEVEAADPSSSGQQALRPQIWESAPVPEQGYKDLKRVPLGSTQAGLAMFGECHMTSLRNNVTF